MGRDADYLSAFPIKKVCFFILFFILFNFFFLEGVPFVIQNTAAYFDVILQIFYCT